MGSVAEPRSPHMSNKKRAASEEVDDHESKRLRHAEPVIHITGNSVGIEEDSQSPFNSTTISQDEPEFSTINAVQDAAPEHTRAEQPFRLMDLPAEIRLEIYRACLTRPFNILLSKKPPGLESNTDAGLLSFPAPTGFDRAAHSWANSTRLRARQSTARLVQVPRALPTTQPLPRPRQYQNQAAPQSQPARPAQSLRLSQYRDRAIHPNPADHQNSVANIIAAARQNQATRGPILNVPRIRGTRARRPLLLNETEPKEPRPEQLDPLLVNLLQASNLVYKEARPVLYAENIFELDIDTALYSLAQLHQRSRGQIRFLRMTIHTHSEILERFAEVVRLSLRYCWRLQVFTINMPFLRAGATSTTGNHTVYANAFDILRWLPRQCQVVLEGNISEDIRSVVQRNANLAKNLDEVQFSARYAHFISSHDIQLAYARRQAIATDNDRG